MNATSRPAPPDRRDSPAPDLLPRALCGLRCVDCAAIIVTYNSAPYIISLLESLPAAAAGLTLRTIIVDNGSSDATIDLVQRYPEAQYVEVGANLGYAAAINIGRDYAHEYSSLLVLNADIILEPGALRKMFEALNDPEIGIVAPMLLDRSGECFPSLRRTPTLARAIGDGLLGSRIATRPGWLSEMVWDNASYRNRHRADWATGAALLISAACDDAVGCWDERFFLYSEETDYATRARDLGYRLEYLPSARVHHRGGGSGQSNALAALLAVNRVRYMEKHGHGPRVYRAVVILHELLRSRNPAHLAALRTVLRRSKWSALIHHLQTQSPHIPTLGDSGSAEIEQ
jgi:GT2 family glycosyltransferase